MGWRERELQQQPFAECHQVQTSLLPFWKSVETCLWVEAKTEGTLQAFPKPLICSSSAVGTSKVNTWRCTWAKPCQERVALTLCKSDPSSHEPTPLSWPLHREDDHQCLLAGMRCVRNTGVQAGTSIGCCRAVLGFECWNEGCGGWCRSLACYM